MQNYLQIASCLVDGETLNQEESLIFLAACKCSRLCVNCHVGTNRLHIGFRANLNTSLKQVMKVVLKERSSVRMCELPQLLDKGKSITLLYKNDRKHFLYSDFRLHNNSETNNFVMRFALFGEPSYLKI